MHTHTQLKRILALSTILFVSLFFVYYTGFIDIKTKSQNISQMEYTLASTMRQSQYRSSIARDVASSDNAIARINNLIIAKDDDVSFIEKLEATAKMNGLEISINSLALDDIPSPEGSPVTSDLTTLRVKATTHGTWAQSYTFLSQLEALPFVLRIDKFALLNSVDTALGEQKKGPQKWQTVLELRVLKSK